MKNLSKKSQLQAHLFICTHYRENGESCARKGSVELRESLKKRCQKEIPHEPGTIRVNASGCLGHCADGITAVLYPEGRWMTGITLEDDNALVEVVRESYLTRTKRSSICTE
jgi:(2Fe-2S) ferredoxin